MIAITTYQKLKQVVGTFKDGKIQSLMLVGPPGVGKTKMVANLFGRTPHVLVKGKSSPVEFYHELFLHRNEPVIIDDPVGLLRHLDAEEILRDLADRDPTRIIRWRTQNKTFEKLCLPDQFPTTSRVCVLANAVGSGGIWTALRSRFQILSIEFSWAEVCNYAAKQKVITDPEILDFAARHAITTPSLRDLEKAVEAKKTSLYDWRVVFTQLATPNRSAAVAGLVNTPGMSNNARARTFQAAGQGSRATFYRYLQKQSSGAASSARASQQSKNTLAVLGCLTATGKPSRPPRKSKTQPKGRPAAAPSRRAAKKKLRTNKTARPGKRGAA